MKSTESANSSFQFTLIAFMLAALVGPVLSFFSITAKLDSNQQIGALAVSTIYDLILLIWPGQVLAIMEASLGQFLATSIAVTANLLLFISLGLVRYRFRKSPKLSVLLWLLISALVGIIAAWSSGFDINYFNILSLALASAGYGILIWSTRLKQA
jgi:hypothetical protein